MRIQSSILRAHVLDAETMSAVDREAIDVFGLPSPVLMERASLESTRRIRQLFPSHRRAVVLAGAGNNGGDGLAIARMLHGCGWSVDVFLFRGSGSLSTGCAHQLEMLERLGLEVRDAGELLSSAFELPEDTILVDALLGIGFSGSLRPDAAALLGHVSASLGTGCHERCVAVDIPSGVNASTGSAEGCVISAGHTLTFAAAKWGHFLSPGADLCGGLHVLDIGIPGVVLEDVAANAPLILREASVRALVRPLPAAGHKGRTGTLRLRAGSTGMPGAASLACGAALRAGAGLVVLDTDEEAAQMVLQHYPEAVCDAEGARRAQAILVGSGLGRAQAVAALRDVLETPGEAPVVVDGDALHALAELQAQSRIPRHAHPLVLTPHPGELAALLGRQVETVMSQWLMCAEEAAERYRAIVVSKGRGALIVAPDKAPKFCAPGPEGLAKAGAGDVLAGLCAAFCLRHTPWSAVQIASWLHAQAAYRAQERHGTLSMQARDLIQEIAPLLHRGSGSVA